MTACEVSSTNDTSVVSADCRVDAMQRKPWIIVGGFVAIVAAGVVYLSTNDFSSTTVPPGFAAYDVELFLVAALGIFALFGLRHLVSDEAGSTHLEAGSDRRTLVVLVRGLGGLNRFASLQALVREQYPTADLLTSTVRPTPLANIDPYRIANVMEHAINEAFADRRYERIVLVGYSLGAVVLRKAWVWGNGIDEDRAALGRYGKREWVDRVERFVSLAGLNRGWSIDPRPKNMSGTRYWLYYLVEKVARLTGTGKLLLAVQRGAPYIADLRVQWIRMTRPHTEPAVAAKPPFVVHLLGDIDDVVAWKAVRTSPQPPTRASSSCATRATTV